MDLSLILEFARADQAGDPFAFHFAPQDYLLRSEGGVFASSVMAWGPELLADLAQVRKPGRDPALLQRLGAILRNFLEPAGFSEHERRIVSAHREQRRIVLTIRSAAAELYALPWELLSLRASGQHLGELPEVLLRYEWPALAPTSLPALPDAEPVSTGRVLLAWSASGGAVPAAEHLAAIESACQKGRLSFDGEADVVVDASCGRLVAALDAARSAGSPVSVLHLLCHGQAAGVTFGLSLDPEDPGSEPVVVDAGRLRQLLSPYFDTLRLVVLSACDSGNLGALGNQLGSVAQSLHRAGLQSVVASRYPLSVTGSIRLTEVLYRKLLIDTESLETALLAARRRLGEDAMQLDWASLQLYARANQGSDTRPVLFRPYRGLLTFLPEHERFFFGREAELQEIEQDLTALAAQGKPRLLMVAGASGTGKSSLVLGGAVPRLLQKQGPALRLSRMRPGAQPMDALDAALAAAGTGDGAVLLVVDQLEELFTHVPDKSLRQTFARRLWSLASDQTSALRVTVLVTLRVDFIGHCGELVLDDAGLCLDRVAYDEAHRVFLSRLSADQLRTVITMPAQRVGLHLEDGLVERMLSELGTEPGALPLLAHTLDLLWQRRVGRTLTQHSYDQLGGVTGALQGRADALMDALSEPDQRTGRRLLVRLVDLGMGQDAALATRRRVAVRTLRPTVEADAARFDHVLTQMVDSRLLVIDEQGPDQLVEVAHEALIRKWPRLHVWVREQSARLAALHELAGWVRQWREHGVLLFGDQLVYADGLAVQCGEDLDSEAELLLEASRARIETSRRVRLMPPLVGLLLLLMVFGIPLLVSRLKSASIVDVLIVFYILTLLAVPTLTVGYLVFLLWRWMAKLVRKRRPKPRATSST